MAKKYKAIYVDPSTKERCSLRYFLGHALCYESQGMIYELGKDIEEPEDALNNIKDYIKQWTCVDEHPELLDPEIYPQYQWLKIENWHVEEIEDGR